MNDMVEAIIHEGNGAAARSVVVLRKGWCLAVSGSLVRFARDRAALDDPFGNGVRGVLEIPGPLAPVWTPGSGYVREQAGGAILLHGGAALLVKPYSIELYASPLDALHARDCRGAIDLSGL